MNLAGTMFKIVLIAMFFSVDISYVISELLKRAELRRFAKLVPEAKVPILGKIRRETIHRACSWRFGLGMCQKGKKQGVNRGFHRCVVGPELVQEKLRLIWRGRSSNGDIPRQKAII